MQRKSRIDLADAVSVALDRSATRSGTHRVTSTWRTDLPLLAGDEVLLEHVVFNRSTCRQNTPTRALVELRRIVIRHRQDRGSGRWRRHPAG